MTDQVLSGEPRDLVFQTRLNAGVFRQDQALGQKILLLLLLLPQPLHLLQQLVVLLLVGTFLLLHLTLEESGRWSGRGKQLFSPSGTGMFPYLLVSFRLL